MLTVRMTVSLWHIVLKILHVFVIIGNNREHSFTVTRLAWLAYEPLLPHQFRHGLLVTCNNDFLTRCQCVDQFWQLCLCFLNHHGTHGCLPYSGSISYDTYFISIK